MGKITNKEFRNNLEILEGFTGKKTYFVYALENRLNNRRYYGVSGSLLNRWEQHRMSLISGRHDNKHMKNDYAKQKELNYRMFVINVCDKCLF